MINIEQTEVQAVLAQLDQAMHNHEQWFDSITRTLVCRLPHDPRDVAGDAHRQCRLGLWYYGAAPATLRGHPGFLALETEHRDMHQLAAKLLQTAASGAAIAAPDFDSLAQALERVRLQLSTLKRELEDALYNLDSLTGANTRIGMLTKLREQQELVKRQVQTCCIAMMDIDHFKAVNDMYGHMAGDRALAVSARYVMSHLRPYDKMFRYGGEEFVAILRTTKKAGAHLLAERIREKVASAPLEFEKQRIPITISIGVASLDEGKDHRTPDDLIKDADEKLYQSKQNGRNRTTA